MSTIEVTPELNMKLGEATSAVRPHARKYLPYLVFAFCFSFYFLPLLRLLLQPLTDEGTLLEGAVRIVDGQLLGRDFFEVVGPGTFYWLALFFKLFGVTFLASRICLFVSSLATALSIYFLSRRVCRGYQVLPCIFVFATYFCFQGPAISHHVDSNCFALLAVVCMVLWQDVHKSWLLIAAGALAGATILTMQPKGILLLFAFLVWLWIQYRRQSTPLTALAWVAGGCCGVVAPMLGYFWSRGALGDLIYANVVWPSQNYGAVNSVHYASGILGFFNHWIVPGHGVNWTVGMAAVLVIPLFFVAALPALVLLLGARAGVKAIRAEIALYWLAGSALWFSELHRKDISHLVIGSPLLVILCVFYLQQRRNKGFRLALQSLSVTSVCLAACTLILALVARPTMTRVGQIRMIAHDPVPTVIDEHVPPGGDIFIYPYSPMYYFLSDTTNPTRYSFAVYNYYTASQFGEIIRSLDQHRVKYVLWDKHLQDKLFEQFPNSRPEHFIMEPYLEAHYKPIWTRDGIFLMERKNDGHGN